MIEAEGHERAGGEILGHADGAPGVHDENAGLHKLILSMAKPRGAGGGLLLAMQGGAAKQDVYKRQRS